MSSVRMCDSCGLVFSENDDGWTTLTGTMQLKDVNGKRYTKEVVQDKCIVCTTSALHETNVPRVALPGLSRAEREYQRRIDLRDEVASTETLDSRAID